MIIDQKNKFIFVKTKKTASTSLEIALSAICGEGAVITAIKEEDEAIRSRLGLPGARNFRSEESEFLPTSADAPRFAQRGFYNHMSAWDIKRILKGRFEEFLKVSIVRNPWDRMVSHYYWGIRGRGSNAPSFKNYLRRMPENINCNERVLFNPNSDQLMVDYVIRYERLEEDLIKLQDVLQVNVDFYRLMGEASSKVGVRPEQGGRYDLFCDYTSGLVESLCEREIATFDYQRPF